jgi:hypothetical protein
VEGKIVLLSGCLEFTARLFCEGTKIFFVFRRHEVGCRPPGFYLLILISWDTEIGNLRWKNTRRDVSFF